MYRGILFWGRGFRHRLCGSRSRGFLGGCSITGAGGIARVSGIRIAGVSGIGGLRGRFLLNQLADLLLQKLSCDLLSHGHPADHGRLRGGAVMSFLPEQGIISVSEHNRCRCGGQSGRLCGRNPHRSHPADSLGLLVGILQIHFQLLNLQFFPFQLQLGQSGVKAHEQVALFYRLPLLHQDFGNSLGVAEVDGLDIVRRDRAVTLLGVAPILGHTHIIKGKHLHRLHIVLPQICPSNQAANANSANYSNSDDDFFKFLHWTQHLHWSAVRRPEYDKFYPHIRQWRVHG